MIHDIVPFLCGCDSPEKVREACAFYGVEILADKPQELRSGEAVLFMIRFAWNGWRSTGWLTPTRATHAPTPRFFQPRWSWVGLAREPA
jgi:hypothetical protein